MRLILGRHPFLINYYLKLLTLNRAIFKPTLTINTSIVLAQTKHHLRNSKKCTHLGSAAVSGFPTALFSFNHCTTTTFVLWAVDVDEHFFLALVLAPPRPHGTPILRCIRGLFTLSDKCRFTLVFFFFER